MVTYFSRARDAVLDWAAKHNDSLEKWGERTKYVGVGLGTILAGYGISKGMDPDTHSKLFVLPAATVFSLGEFAKVFGEYARDRARGETDPVRTAGYVARVIAPVYAAWKGANNVWEPINDVTAPITTWVAGAGMSRIGEKRVYEMKLDASRRFRRNLGGAYDDDCDVSDSMIRYAMEGDPEADVKAVANSKPLRDIQDEK